MKSSRAMLLAAMLFVAPAFADQDGNPTVQNTEAPAQNTPATEDNKEVVKAEDKAPATEDNKPVVQNEAPAQNTTSTETTTAPEAPKAEDKTEEVKTETPSWFAAKLAVLTGFGTTFANYTVTPVAELITIPALKQLLRISYLKGGRFESSIPTVGKSMVAVAAAGAAYKLYQATQEQDETDEDDVFGE